MALSRPDLPADDKVAVLGVLDTPHLALGPKLTEFERRIADNVGCRHAVAVNSGTTAPASTRGGGRVLS